MCCRKIVPFAHYYKEQISSCNHIEHSTLMNEISLILSNLPKDRKEKRSIIALLVTGFMDLAYEGISSFLHNRSNKVLNKAVVAMKK